MQLGMVGLGRMGGNMAARLRAAGHEVVGYDADPTVSEVPDLAALVATLDAPRVLWLMLPVSVTDAVLDDLVPLLSAGDLIIEGGNTKWTSDAARAQRLDGTGIGYLDCGVSGGIWGKEYGYALMVGGAAEDVARAQPIFDALSPAGDGGFVHAGAHGAGHFAKMVHNGIEYALMQAYAEGWELLEKAEVVTDVAAVFDSWREGTVIRSWLLDLIALALADDPHLAQVRGYADDSGEGRWTVDAAIDLGVPMPALTSALFARFVSRQDESPAMKLVAAMRQQFGGHAVHAETVNLDETV